MTCLIVCDLIKKLEIKPKATFLQISKNASQINGTSANLKENDRISIYDLLHGLMLPSGNDAALALAENFGIYLYFKKSKEQQKDQSQQLLQKNNNNENYFIQNQTQLLRKPQQYFLEVMNKYTRKLDMQNTFFVNVHGLPNDRNYSTALDIAKLSYFALQNPLIKEIASKQQYKCKVLTENQYFRDVYWENTNKLLNENGFIGLKTGVTNTAGPCLSCCYLKDNLNLIIVSLASCTMDARWDEMKLLINWLEEELKQINQSKIIIS